ncbi:MAG: hypothetical protein WD772_13280 [Pseudohongiellaceae bacterium]
MKKFNSLLLSLLLCASMQSGAQTPETGFLDRSITIDNVEHRYQVYVPRSYRSDSPLPAILFLHGAGERGDDGLKQTQVGIGAAIRLNPARWPAITVFPQVPTGLIWDGEPARAAMAALDATLVEFAIDDSRVYLTGISMGGRGTLHLGYHYSDRFAAIVAICTPVTSLEFTLAEFAVRTRTIPMWLFHGDADVVVPVDHSHQIVAARREASAPGRYTEFPGVNHNSWDPAYAMEELAEWLFEQKK